MREESLASMLHTLRESMKRVHSVKYAEGKMKASYSNSGHAGGTGGPTPHGAKFGLVSAH